MGIWGPGLYSNDTARDLKSLLKTLLRLPLDVDALVEIVVSHSDMAHDLDHEDYSTFWLVLADQFHRQGINAPKVFSQAREIISTGRDDEMMAAVEMGAAARGKRVRLLEALALQLEEPPPKKPRKTLTRPQTKNQKRTRFS